MRARRSIARNLLTRFDHRRIVAGKGSYFAPKILIQHYYAIASKATILKPHELAVPEDKFEKKFGLPWKTALANGNVYNAMDAVSAFAFLQSHLILALLMICDRANTSGSTRRALRKSGPRRSLPIKSSSLAVNLCTSIQQSLFVLTHRWVLLWPH